MAEENQSFYHYTDINALRGIIENRKIYLTCHSFLNDSSEFSAGYEVLLDSLRARVSGIPGDNKAHIFLAAILRLLEDTIFYSASFSKHRNLLSQWRGYCPKEGGYSIEFDRKILSTLTGHQGRGGNSINERTIADCIYAEDSIKKSSIDIAHKTIETLLKDIKTPTGHISLHEAFTKLLKFVVQVKDKCFKEEDEVRLYTYTHKAFTETYSRPSLPLVGINKVLPPIKIHTKEVPNFRSRENYIIPYFEELIPKNTIKSITIGPCKDPQMSELGLIMLLSKVDPEKIITIYNSDLPFRV